MFEFIKNVGAFVGLLTGAFVFYDRLGRSRPIASLTVTNQGTRKIACIRISNIGDYDIAIVDAMVKPRVYFLTEDIEVRSLV